MNPPDWFTTLIANGLARLYSLNLEGCPAADVLPATRIVWQESIWTHLQHADLTHYLDAPRLTRAFESLYVNSIRWPSPAMFLRALPPRPEPKRPPALPPGAMSAEEQARRTLTNLRNRELLGLRQSVAAGGDA